LQRHDTAASLLTSLPWVQRMQDISRWFLYSRHAMDEDGRMIAKYDTIGVNYAQLRRPDPRIARTIHDALGPARTVLNVGAGTGSYEPRDRQVTAVEPSIEMIRKRAPTAAEAVQGTANTLPFDDKSFDASMAILTIHHWPDKAAGLAEMRRVTCGRIVLLTFDPSHRPWQTDYFPQLAALDDQQMPAMAEYEAWLGSVAVTPVLVPHDCSDGFLYAYWRRPWAYLDPDIRSGSSSFWAIGDIEVGLAKLRRDLENGAWERRYGALLGLDTYDAGYRLVSAN
jgi:SAM-dependent methyltransferase